MHENAHLIQSAVYDYFHKSESALLKQLNSLHRAADA